MEENRSSMVSTRGGPGDSVADGGGRGSRGEEHQKVESCLFKTLPTPAKTGPRRNAV